MFCKFIDVIIVALNLKVVATDLQNAVAAAATATYSS